MTKKLFCPKNTVKAVLVFIICGFTQALPGQPGTFLHSNYEDPGEWKTFIVNVDKVAVPPPPDEQTTKSEAEALKLKVVDRDDNTMNRIYYWNAGSPAYRWNQIGYSLISFRDFPTFLRTPTAWMNMAIYDATAAAWKAKYLYQRKRPAEIDPGLVVAIKAPMTPSYPCEHTVTAAAAAKVLAYFFPQKADSIMTLAKEAAASRVAAGVQFPSDVEAAWKLGEQVADLVIQEAKMDGFSMKWNGQINTDPKMWRGEYPAGITARDIKPLVLKSGHQFRPPAPPDFAMEMEELKSCKQTVATKDLAYYWANRTGFDIWTDLASTKIFEYNLEDNTPLCARIYALLNVAVHDAAIAIMDAKYAYWGTRPDQYDENFKPLIPTPPFPGYPSGHATASSTAATVLSHLFPADAAQFQKIANECAESRFYAGIHFRTDNDAGLELGKKIGDYVMAEWSGH